MQYANGVHAITEESLQTLDTQHSACSIPVANKGFIPNKGPIPRLNESKRAGYLGNHSTAGDIKIAYEEELGDGNLTALRNPHIYRNVYLSIRIARDNGNTTLTAQQVMNETAHFDFDLASFTMP